MSGTPGPTTPDGAPGGPPGGSRGGPGRGGALSRAVGKVPPPVYFLMSGTSSYVGSGLAVGLFASSPALAVGWGRILVASLILVAWRRPWRRWPREHPWTALGWTVAFGLALGGTNLLFYESIARLPLGTAVSLEYLSPVILAAIGGRGWLARAAVVLAFAGVATIGGLGVDLTDPDQLVGTIYALLAGATWAMYMFVGQRQAARVPGADTLAVGLAIAAVVYAPVGLPGSGPLFRPENLLFVVAVAVLSSVVPYVIDQVAFRRLTAAMFALLSSLLPVTSLLVGLVLLGQVPNAAEIAGLVMVSVAVGLASRPAPPRQGRPGSEKA
ncbi:EamA family transporter [Georgenia sp. Z1344]|uniref:EamA family transporter n=1 Tax=Georgenia sp. Z1344 TaxID=3416706 RepID=UPI003CEC6957